MNDCPICDAAIEDRSTRQICQNCGNGDRTRSLFLLYKKLSSFTEARTCLAFSQENWLSDDFFAACERSIYRGRNHLDIQNIDRPEGAFDWVTCNHVLEHIENDVHALKELYRIISPDGVVQITVPTPALTYSTRDWGYPDEGLLGHYRNYGADFIHKAANAVPNAFILVAFNADPISPFRDMVFFIAKTAETAKELADTLFTGGITCLPIPKYYSSALA